MGDIIKDMLKGFRDFILRGNVVDLAIGVVIGAAFNSVVQALVKDFLTPLIAAIAQQPNFSSLTFTVHGSQFNYGDFINAAISFLLDALAIYFFIVVPINALSKRLHKKGPPPPPDKETCPVCFMSIPVNANRCPECTSWLRGPQAEKAK